VIAETNVLICELGLNALTPVGLVFQFVIVGLSTTGGDVLGVTVLPEVDELAANEFSALALEVLFNADKSTTGLVDSQIPTGSCNPKSA
jgi:hypothetical protein